LPNGLRVTAGVAFDQLTEVFKESKDLGISSFFDSTAINAVRISDEEIIDTSFGAFKTYQTTSYQEIYNRYKSISIPISIGYFKRKGAWAYYGDVGIVYNIRRWQRGQAYTNGDVEIRLARFDNESHHINDKKNTGLHLTAGFGVSKQISHRWSWAAGPHIQYGINSWTDGWPLDIRYTNIGINTSMSFTF